MQLLVGLVNQTTDKGPVSAAALDVILACRISTANPVPPPVLWPHKHWQGAKEEESFDRCERERTSRHPQRSGCKNLERRLLCIRPSSLNAVAMQGRGDRGGGLPRSKGSEGYCTCDMLHLVRARLAQRVKLGDTLQRCDDQGHHCRISTLTLERGGKREPCLYI